LLIPAGYPGDRHLASGLFHIVMFEQTLSNELFWLSNGKTFWINGFLG
jgi:hypothetical protein